MLMMATAGIFRLEQQEFLNLTEIHSVVTSRIVTAVDLNKSDHTHTGSAALAAAGQISPLIDLIPVLQGRCE